MGTDTGLLWAFAIMAVAALGIGWMAQGWKHRTGAAWAIGSFVFMIALYYAWFHYIESPDRRFSGDQFTAYGIMSAFFGGGFLAVIVASLPRR